MLPVKASIIITKLSQSAGTRWALFVLVLLVLGLWLTPSPYRDVLIMHGADWFGRMLLLPLSLYVVVGFLAWNRRAAMATFLVALGLCALLNLIGLAVPPPSP